MPDIPDEALDRHTRRGRMKGRGLDHFLKHGAKLVGPRPLEEYEKKCEATAVAFWKSTGDERLGELEERQKEKVRQVRENDVDGNPEVTRLDPIENDAA